MELAPGTAVGNYLIERPIGVGGMAVVYLARHATLGTHHAIKVVLLPMSRDRVLQEGRMQAKIRHPNVVSVVDLHVIAGAPALVLEYVHGPTLEALMERHPLSLDQVDAVADGLFAGVNAAHELELAHRDLKPSNILMAVQGGRFLPKIADFGLVKVLNPSDDPRDIHRRTRTNAVMGTPCYMAPEQHRDAGTAGLPADVFSLGCILYEMLTGRLAFFGTERSAIFEAAAAGRYTPVERLCPDAPPRIVRAIDAALRPQAADRPANAGALRTLWFADGTAPRGDVWPLEWIREDWSPPRTPDFAGQTWGPTPTSGEAQATPGDGPAPSADPAPAPAPPAARAAATVAATRPPRRPPPSIDTLPTPLPVAEEDDALPSPRRGRWGLLGMVLGVLAAGGAAALWLNQPVQTEDSTDLQLVPAADVAGVVAARARPLTVAVAVAAVVGTDPRPALVDAIRDALTVPQVRLVDAPTPFDPSQWAAAGRQAGADVVLLVHIGRRGAFDLVNLDRLDVAAGRVRSRAFGVFDRGADIAPLVARALSSGRAAADSGAMLGELDARRAELSAQCQPGEVVWRATETGRAELISASEADAPCVAGALGSWLLPAGSPNTFTWNSAP
jgi:serine/threonine protein kinase